MRPSYAGDWFAPDDRAQVPVRDWGYLSSEARGEDVAAEDLTIGPGGEAPALDGPGLGVEVVEAKLRAHARAP